MATEESSTDGNRLGRTVIGGLLCPHPDDVQRWSREAEQRRAAFLKAFDAMMRES